MDKSRGRGTGTAVPGRRRTPDGEVRRTEDFLRLRPPQGRKRTADRLTLVRSGRWRTRDGGVRPPQGRIRTADRTFLFEPDGAGHRTGSSSASRTDLT